MFVMHAENRRKEQQVPKMSALFSHVCLRQTRKGATVLGHISYLTYLHLHFSESLRPRVMLPCDRGQLRTPGILSCFYYTTFLTAQRTYAQLVPLQCRVCADGS